jgi:hypothetical protein
VKKEKDRSILNKMGDSVSHLATKLILKDPSAEFAAKVEAKAAL